MFFIPRNYKLALMLVTLSCLTLVVVPGIPLGAGKYMVYICFFLSEARYISQHIKDIRLTVIGKLLLLIIIAFIIAYFTSPNYVGSATGAIRLTLKEMVAKYFAIAYAFICIYEEDDMRPALRLSFYALIALTFFGVINLIDHHSYLVDELASITRNTTDTDVLGGRYEGIARFRVQSMFFNPFDYGYACLVLLFLHSWGYLKEFESKSRFYTVIACAVFGVLACNCRTVLFCLMVGAITFMMIYKEQTGRIRYAIFTSLGLLLLYVFVPPIQQFISYIFSMFQSDADISGSTMEMRMTQYARVLYYWHGHEWFGHGIDFFWIDLGWSGGKEAAIDQELFGLEGVLMALSLERGLVGVIAYLTFYSVLCYQVYKMRSLDKTTAALGISVLVSYLVFANMTGELLSVFPTLLITGVVFSLLYQRECEELEEETDNEKTDLKEFELELQES